jgi:large subunit ribosomal protein L29
MDTDAIRALKTDDLYLRLEQARKEMMNLRFQFSMGQLSDSSRLKLARRDVARLLTVLRERELEAAQEGTQA